jgi:cobalt-zinc-cadmium resistance protein CzcA
VAGSCSVINRFLQLCFDRRGVFIALAVLTVVVGYVCWTHLPIEAYPELSPVTVQVTTQLPGLAAEEIEQQVTVPLERGLANTPGLVSMRSSSTFGLSLITLIFQDGAEDYWERQRVTEHIAQVILPPNVTPGLDPVSGPSGEVYRYTLESPSKNLMQLSELQRWTVIPALNQVQGVANVDNFGGYTKEYSLELDPDALTRYGVAVGDVVNAIDNNSAIAAGGRVTRGEQSYIVRGVGRVQSLDDIGAVLVTQKGGVPVYVRDLGRMTNDHQVREGILGKDNDPDSIEGIVDLLKYQNPSKVLDLVHAKVAELNRQLAAQDVKIVPYIDRDNLVHATVENVGHTIAEGVVLVCVILFLFLGSARVSLIVAATIPVALATVFVLMTLFHMPANLFSLGAIDFGVIVDGAIVVTEALLRLRERIPEDELTQNLAVGAASQVARPIFFATLIIITAYFPLLAFQNAEGKLFKPMAFTVGFALAGALLYAITLAPGLTYLALRKPLRIRSNRLIEGLRRGYRDGLGKLLGRLPIAYLAAAGALAGVLVLGAGVGREFLPDLDEGALWMQVQLPTGISLDKASEMAGELRRTVLAFPEVSYIVTQTGRNDTGTDPWTPSHIESGVGLKPYASWPDHESKAAFVQKLSGRLARLPGMQVGISQPIVDGVNDMVGGAHSPLVLRIYGDDFRELRRIGGEIVDVLRATPGTGEASIFQEPPVPQIAITADRQAAARYGINVADIMNLVQNAVGSAPITQIYTGDQIHNITLHLPRTVTSDPDKLGQLVLTAANGAQVPLAQVAHITLQSGESTISHEQGRRQLTIRIDNRGRALSQYLADAQRRIDAHVRFDRAGYQLEWAGQFQNEQRAQQRLSLVMGLVLLVMGALLFFQFKTLRHTLLILGVVPLAALGGLIALTLRGETLNIATAVGFIALFGVAVQNGIIMVSNIRRVRGRHDTLAEAVLAGASERFRPVLLTATVASVGMFPAALHTGVGTDVQRGLATVVVGGLAIATLLTLFILPAFYFAIETWFEARGHAHAHDEPEHEH